MLFANPIYAFVPLQLHQLRQVSLQLSTVELQLPEERYGEDVVKDLIKVSNVTPAAIRLPKTCTLGWTNFQPAEAKYWLNLLHKLGMSDIPLIAYGAAVPLGELFEFLEAHPFDFDALDDYKQVYVNRAVEQLQQLQSLADGIPLLLENSPMASHYYFEPGCSKVYPALRTPHHLQHIAEKTQVRISFNAANARITSNALTYMHRSRSLFAGATEREITSAPKTWIDFYRDIAKQVAYIRLSYAVSWGDTPETSHIPFPYSSCDELLTFAEQIDEETPISLCMHTPEQLSQMLKIMHELKRS